ncbi:hypothetical protein [Pseudomonas putida]|uniref:hypothetical protein n=1 Tax=Pseudomonas putida TaxID=303 RepID=UPI0018AA0E36|nr:hypothetical protein [Pseudomonas putida]MBF8660753.1 hypothetical protein [Pseudomonas putida]
MILVDMPRMLLGFMIYLFSQVLLWLLIAGLLALLIPRSRRYLAARRWRFAVLMVLLAVGSVPYVESSYRQWQDWRAHHPRLEQQVVLGELVLPAGTLVDLANLQPYNDLSGNPVPYGLESIRRADFDRAPGTIKGLQVRSLQLWDGSATIETLNAQAVDGWRCEPGMIEYHFPFEARFTLSAWRLYRCVLTPGIPVGGIDWPGAVTLVDGPDGWEVRSDEQPVRLQGIELRSMTLSLDRPDGQASDWRGYANQPFDYGPMHYPADIRVSRQQDRMLFSLPPSAQARNVPGATTIEGGQTVVQSLSGEVLAIRDNPRGIYFPDEFIVP